MLADVFAAMKKLAVWLARNLKNNKNAINTILDNTEKSKNDCIRAWSVVQQGITCYLAVASLALIRMMNTLKIALITLILFVY